jgi:hypothetical protein
MTGGMAGNAARSDFRGSDELAIVADDFNLSGVSILEAHCPLLVCTIACQMRGVVRSPET